MKLLEEVEKVMKKGWELRYNPKGSFYAFLPQMRGEVGADTLDELIDKINSVSTKP